MGTRFRQWLRDVAARLAAQTIVTIVFATIPIIYTLWEWRGIIVEDHRRQVELDSMITRQIGEVMGIQRRMNLLEWKQKTDSTWFDLRIDHVEDNMSVLKRSIGIINHNP